MPKKLNTTIFIDRSNTIHNNKYDYSKYKYINAHTNSIIICPIHGEFLQKPNNHLSGRGCSKCGIISISLTQRQNKETVIKKFQTKHKNKYDYSKFEYINDRHKSIIICKKHGEFLQCSHDHRKGIGCPKCGIENRSSKNRLSIEDFIQKSNKTHDNKYDYTKFKYINNNTNGIIICHSHGEFLQSPNPHIRGNGCPKCGIIKYSKAITLTNEEFVNKSRKIHGNKYDYSKSDYINTSKKLIITCPIHGDFYQTPGNHLQGNGCNKCRYENLKKDQIKPTKQFIKEANKTHENKYDYSKVIYNGAHKKICIICPKHGIFHQTANHHIRGAGCPKCQHTISKFEKEFLDYLKIPNTKENRQVYIARKRVDGFKNNTIYEYLGDFWHGNLKKFKPNDINQYTKKTFSKLNEETFNKLNQFKKRGYKINYIWESDWKRFKDGIDDIPNIISF